MLVFLHGYMGLAVLRLDKLCATNYLLIFCYFYINAFDSCYFQKDLISVKYCTFFLKLCCAISSRTERAKLQSPFQILDQSW